MYVTRPMSRYQDNPQAAAEPPPDGPGSGILVVEDEAAVERATRWWGLWLDRQVYGLPFPQSRKLKVEYATARMDGGGRAGTTHRTHTHTYLDDVVFVPVVGQPLSSGRYYAVRATGEARREGVGVLEGGGHGDVLRPLVLGGRRAAAAVRPRRRLPAGGGAAAAAAREGFHGGGGRAGRHPATPRRAT